MPASSAALPPVGQVRARRGSHSGGLRPPLGEPRATSLPARRGPACRTPCRSGSRARASLPSRPTMKACGMPSTPYSDASLAPGPEDVLHRLVLHEVLDPGLALVGDADQHQPLRAVLLVQLVQVRDAGHARPAPRRPELDHHHLPLQPGQRRRPCPRSASPSPTTSGGASPTFGAGLSGFFVTSGTCPRGRPGPSSRRARPGGRRGSTRGTSPAAGGAGSTSACLLEPDELSVSSGFGELP